MIMESDKMIKQSMSLMTEDNTLSIYQLNCWLKRLVGELWSGSGDCPSTISPNGHVILCSLVHNPRD